MKRMLRFVVRNSSDSSDGLILGSLTSAGASHFKKGIVYEVTEVIDGELSVKEVGPSWMTEKHWSKDVNRLLDEEGKYIILSSEEYKNYGKKKGSLRWPFLF